MSRRMGFSRTLRAYNGEIADEMHVFSDARQGTGRVKLLLLRQGRIIEICSNCELRNNTLQSFPSRAVVDR